MKKVLTQLHALTPTLLEQLEHIFDHGLSKLQSLKQNLQKVFRVWNHAFDISSAH